MRQNDDTATTTAAIDIKKRAVSRYLQALILIGVFFFLPAGTWRFWQAWLWIAILFIPMAFVGRYLVRHDPELLRRRLQFREKRSTQKLFIKITSVYYFAVLFLPGFDHRYGWSNVPAWVIFLSDLLILVGYGLFFLVMRENSFAARTVEIMPDQKVIQTGPYAVVRHPMYVAASLMWILTPLALGSWWGFVLMVPFPLSLVFRILDEEKTLVKDLPDYQAYMLKVKYRLLPGVW